MLFLKGPNTLAAHGDTITLPAGKERVDHEAELAVVIGEQCRNVPADEAEDVIAGYTCLNDVSNRDDQREEQNWIRGKAFDGAAPIGPVLATPDELPEDAAISLRVNGDVRQESTIDLMYFSVPELIEEITTYVTLEAGDVIATGTPEGVTHSRTATESRSRSRVWACSNTAFASEPRRSTRRCTTAVATCNSVHIVRCP